MAESKKTAPSTGAVRDAFADIKLKVDGIEVTASDAVFVVDDINLGMRRSAALMSWWGKVWATAEAEQIEADAFYRHWLATKMKELMGDGPGKAAMSEAKAKAAIESEPQFIALKKAIGQAARNVRVAQTQFAAAEKNASLLQSLGANEREEKAAGRRDTTRERLPARFTEGEDAPAESDDEEDGETKKVSAEKVKGGEEKMREAFGTSKKKRSKED